jgi:peptidoglycan/xylan/chitin deacetylase (PgdA/CDA1 family)
MKPRPFACLLVVLPLTATAGCLAWFSPAGQPQPPIAAIAALDGSAGRNTGLRRSADVSGLPVPPGQGAVPRPSGPPGNLVILPWAGFRAAVTYTFDDGNSSQLVHYPALQALGVPMTFYLTTDKPEAGSPVWAQAVRDGHELGNHSTNHAQTGLPGNIDGATDFIKRTFAVDVWTMASPFGDPSYLPLARSRFLVNRGVGNGLVGVGRDDDNVDPYDLYCYSPPQQARAGLLDAEVDSARQAGKWRIILIHGFAGGSDGAYLPIDLQEFIASVNHAKSFGDLWLDSMVAVASYWRGQRALAAALPQASGASTTWSWTLPPHLPPGKYLRVKVDGGTLYQNGKALAWNERGYYEVGLDAGSLTLSPDVALPAH